MTWTKLSDDFADDCARAGLSDAAFRTHVEGLLWAMRRENAGSIDAVDVRRFAESVHTDDAVEQLVRVGFWADDPGGWQIRHHMEHQPEPEVINARREAATERKRRHRLNAVSRRDGTSDGMRDETQDGTRYPGRVGTGRNGQLRKERSTKRKPLPAATSYGEVDF